MTVIDVHTHMLTDAWVEQLRAHGGPRYAVQPVRGGQQAVHMDGAPFMTLMPGMFDYEARIAAMDAAKVDLAIVSLTCPNVFWGGAEVSAATARLVNDSMAAAQRAWPSRIRWLASLPWQHPERAVAELERACAAGAVGVMTLGNIDQRSLTDPLFAPVWQAIDARALPVLVHPTAPPGVVQMDMTAYNLIAQIGFMFDTSLAIARMIYDGFFDRYPKLKIIAGHGGGTLPFLAGRMEMCFERMPPVREKIAAPPGEYLQRIWYDSVVYRQDALAQVVAVAGAGRLLYGSDYPHNIGDMQGCLARVDALPPDQAKAARSGNAQAIFRL